MKKRNKRDQSQEIEIERYISDMRTGAQPAIMCKHLAYSTDTVTIIGAGLQGYTSLLCMPKNPLR